MEVSTTWRRSGARKLALLGVLAAFAVVLFAVTSSSASAGLIGSFQLRVIPTGTGGGTVSSSDGQISCLRTAQGVNTGLCTTTYPFGNPDDGSAVVNLTAAPNTQSEFVSWSVNPSTNVLFGCGLSASCIVSVDSNTTVQALFQASPNVPLTVVRAGPAAGVGSVTSSPAGINCSPIDQIDCSHNFPANTAVTLTASIVGTGATFGGWGGACSTAQGNVCTVSVLAATQVIANFNTQTFPVTASVSGPGEILANVGASSFQCPPTCTGNVAANTSVTFTAQPDAGAAFTSWGGSCASSGTNPTCTVTVSAAISVSAAFQSTEVQAAVVGNRIRKVGPANALRQLQVTINAEEELATVVFRVRRNGTTLQSRTFRNVDADQQVLRMNLRNGIASGRAQLVVIMTNESGTQKTQNRNLNIPKV